MRVRRAGVRRGRAAPEGDADTRSAEEAENQKIREKVRGAPPPARPPRARDVPPGEQKRRLP